MLVEPENFRPQVVIELDDRSHQRADRQERDAFVNAALKAAGLAICRVPAQRAYTQADLMTKITAAIAKSPRGTNDGSPG